MAEESLDLAFGFLNSEVDYRFQIPSPEIATVQVLTRSVTDFKLNTQETEL